MSVLIEDSPRPYQAGWIIEASQNGLCSGAVMTPWATPWASHAGQGKKPSIRDRTAELRAEGVEVWFDPTTHALQMGGVGDFRYYDEYDLWGGLRGELSTDADREEHVRRVFQLQDSLGVNHLAPTSLLHTGLSNASSQVLDLAKEAIRQDPDCWLSIAGTSPFWNSGSALDAHVGALAALQPAGWFLTVVRPVAGVPVAADVEEVHGLCRTTRALAEDAPIHISYGDLAGLPAVAAGAVSVGSGWDQRQRVCAYPDYAPRTAGSGGGWYTRPTVRVILGSLAVKEAALLGSRDAALATQLGGLPAPGPKEAFMHHLTALNHVIGQLRSEVEDERRWRTMMAFYTNAVDNWPEVQRLTGSPLGADDWVGNLVGGLQRYRSTEGWV